MSVWLDQQHVFRERLYGVRTNLSMPLGLGLALLFAGLIAICAQVRIFVEFTPVPFTLQVYGVLLAGVVLGPRYGGFSVGSYIMMGICGLPVFASGDSGAGYLQGATGGYLIGFLLAGVIVGRLSNDRGNHSILRVHLTMIGAMSAIYLLGWVWLCFILSITLIDGLLIGVMPFIVIDLVKCVAAALTARWLLPGEKKNESEDYSRVIESALT